ncbi:MBL fold metallo-hydrolase [Escherichia coli]
MTPLIKGFYDPATGTVSYVLADRVGGVAAIIDPVLDYDPKSGRTQTTSADKLIDYIDNQHLTVKWLLETHAHADHLTAAHYLREKVGGVLLLAKKLSKFRVYLSVFLTLNTLLHWMVHSSIICWLMVKALNLDLSQYSLCRFLAIHLLIWLLRSLMQFFLVILFSCQMWELRDVIFQEEMQNSFIILFARS